MQFTFNCLSLAGKLTNHEIPEKLVEDVKKKSREFHDFSVEEKEFSDKVPFTPIRSFKKCQIWVSNRSGNTWTLVSNWDFLLYLRQANQSST
ncbi:hypothetical protein D0Y65_010002 [Glycine soja]|uniref:Uncharacterized protein n=2 Tax=Glycine subgen. Soja TaxID=1462606 RepID=A0A0R0KDW4_SOYBN|nr:hypothetical protein D0Y65_010002 [Glycine soja]